MDTKSSYCKLLIQNHLLPFFHDCNLKNIVDKKDTIDIPILSFLPTAEDSDIHLIISKKSRYSSIKFQSNSDFFYHIENRTLPNNWDLDYYQIQRNVENEVVIVKWNPRKQVLNEEVLNSIISLFHDFKEKDYSGPIEVNSKKSIKYHLVQEKEDLYSICKEQNLTMDQIMKRNKLDSTILYIGQILDLSELPSTLSEEVYQFKEGDTLASIAEKKGLKQEDLIRYNGFHSNLLNVGTIIKFPK